MINSTEDGIRVQRFETSKQLQAALNEITGPSISPEWRARFVDSIPDDYTDTRDYYIVECGDPVIPKAVQTVTEREV